MTDDRREEFALALTKMLDSSGWLDVALVAIRQKLAKKWRTLKKGHHTTLAEVEVLQAEIGMLEEMLEPRKFFKVEGEKGSEP